MCKYYIFENINLSCFFDFYEVCWEGIVEVEVVKFWRILRGRYGKRGVGESKGYCGRNICGSKYRGSVCEVSLWYGCLKDWFWFFKLWG